MAIKKNVSKLVQSVITSALCTIVCDMNWCCNSVALKIIDALVYTASIVRYIDGQAACCSTV